MLLDKKGFETMSENSAEKLSLVIEYVEDNIDRVTMARIKEGEMECLR